MMIVSILAILIAVQHLFFLVLEMFFWTKPLGLRIFRQSAEKAESSKILAANQGLYNGFLAAGLLWGALSGRADILAFFLSCVLVAGIYGGWSVNKRLFLIQGVPALLALILLAAGF